MKGGRAPVEFVLVGPRTAPTAVPSRLARLIGFNWNSTMEQPGPPGGPDAPWRLLTIDFRKSMGWGDGEKPTARARKLLRAVLEARQHHPGAQIRIVNVPARTAIVRFLLDQGADLITFDDLAKGESLLGGSGAPAPR